MPQSLQGSLIIEVKMFFFFGLFFVHSQADLRPVSIATLHKDCSAVCRQWLWVMWFSWIMMKANFFKEVKKGLKWSATLQKDLHHFPGVFGFEEWLFRTIPQLALLHDGAGLPERGGCRPRKPKLLQQLLVHSRMRKWQDQRVRSWDRRSFLHVELS